ncbi:hypothetical protein JTF54_gp02 [Microbacterium phage Kaijohn]|uniref:Uncharacterized protein n=1 Tax=Microbacterium phage Kaijohn TaxID=2653750 RepID=A0A5Q2WJ63_9CAUD|nr:hypothetical protein JTF54_gp02 [Microbacterium phage Kaijohn]QGH78522.1 hypothetical protein SEA_KAIJOHN_2 [Microbacterium phage Kaijohn]
MSAGTICPQPCEHLSQQDAREGRTCPEHPCSCPPAEPACTCPSGDGSLRWPCPEHPPTTTPARDTYRAAWEAMSAAERDKLQSDLERFGAAVAGLQAAIAELLLPVFEAFADLVERLAWLIEDSRPVRWLNRRARRAAMRRHPSSRWEFTPLPALPASRIYTPPAALSWVDVDRLAERAGQDLGTFDAILAAPTPAEIPPAPLCQPVNAGQHVGRMRRHTWRELLQLPGKDMA